MKMIRMGPLVTFVIVISLFLSVPIKCQEVEDESEFSYNEEAGNGPKNWGNIHEEWASCNNGDLQSPIDLIHKRVVEVNNLGRLKKNYKPANATMVNRGHDIMIRWPEEGAGTFTVNGTEYLLRQCHWHSPSEHSVNGRRYALEAHLVHQSVDGQIAVLGILYTIGRPDTFLEEMLKHLEPIANNLDGEKVVGDVDPRHIKLGSRKYYRYMGSLTTPPCTGGVTWTILKKVRTVSREQVRKLREAVHDDSESNARPLQLLNDRQVHLYTPRKIQS